MNTGGGGGTSSKSVGGEERGEERRPEAEAVAEGSLTRWRRANDLTEVPVGHC